MSTDEENFGSMCDRLSFEGEVLSIHVAEQGGARMCALLEARLIAGVGIEGDRYATGRGHYSVKPQPERQVTLIEVETLEALARDHDIVLGHDESRRNITVRGVPLNHLVGCEFRVGEAILEGVRLNVPCKYLEKLTGKHVFEPLKHRSGLNCIIKHGAMVRPGDPVRLA